MRHNDDISNDKIRWKVVKLIQCFKRKIISGIWKGSYEIYHFRLRDAKKERARSLASIHSTGRRASEEPKQGRWRKTSIHVIGAERGSENHRNWFRYINVIGTQLLGWCGQVINLEIRNAHIDGNIWVDQGLNWWMVDVYNLVPCGDNRLHKSSLLLLKVTKTD